jgi:hypothetical protein
MAVRKFLMAIPGRAAQEKYFPVLLPPMCFSR